MRLNDDISGVTAYPEQIIVWSKSSGDRIVFDKEALMRLFILASRKELIDCQKVMVEVYDG